MSRKFVVVDLETTGNTYEKGDRIIQISAVTIENYQIVDQFTSFVNPGISVPPFIEELTGIHDDMIKDAPTFSEIADEIYGLLADSIFVAHNVPFDLGFLQGELGAAGYRNCVTESIDTVELSKVLMPMSTSYKLSDMSEMLGFEHENPHQADSDALVTSELLLFLIENIRQLPLITIEKLTDLAHHLKSNIALLLHSIIQEKRMKLEDLPEALEVHRGIALRKKFQPDTVDNNESVEYPSSMEEKQKLLTSFVNGYEKREGQMQMMDTVYKAFVGEKHAVIEAGTGIGKSLGYLIPALYYAVKHHQSVIISTYTLQMQDQLLYNEIRRLKDIIPFPFRVSVLKGRSNYLNMLKFEQSLTDRDHSYDNVLTKMQILVWLIQTETGDMDEVNFSSGGKYYKERMKHDGWFLQKEKDPWISRDFYMHARHLALQSEIVITNHSMLLVDIEQERNLLPDSQFIIIDEAHNFIKAASKSLGKKLEYNAFKFLINNIGTFDKNQLFAKIEQIIQHHNIVPKVSTSQFDNLILRLDAEVDDFFMLLSKWIIKSERKLSQNVAKHQVRFTEEMRQERDWQSVLMCAERTLDFHKQIRLGLEDRLELIKEQKEIPITERAFVEEANSFMLEWLTLGAKIKDFMLTPNIQEVVWMEGDTRTLPNSIGLYSEPENPGGFLKEHFFSDKNSVVMTSATLTVDHSFKYFLQEVGLNNYSLMQTIIPSPFAYDKMAKLMIPTDLPEVRHTKTEEYIEAISGHLAAIASVTDGRMLVLFTSYDMLRKTYNLMKDSGALDEFIMLAQGVTSGSRTRLTKSFQQFNKAILFGTSSFWEGVDIPGKDLTCLVIVRLPFSPPNEPIIAARNEAIKKRGKNPFSEHSLPEAVIRFKQGFGRLIRTETDRGVVIVMDRRIDTSSYGQAFLQSLPNVPIERGPLKEIISTIEKWL